MTSNARKIQTHPVDAERLPGGQHETTKWPVLTYGPTPEVEKEDWQMRIWGACDNPFTVRFDELDQFEYHTLIVDYHCVTTWSRMDICFGGYLMKDIIAKAQPHADCQHILQHAYGGYTTNNTLDVMNDEDVMLVVAWDDKPLPREHGGPARIHVPKRWAWKGAKWVNGLEFLVEDQRGFWEVNGYHNEGDPWGEGGERYSHQERAWQVRKEGNELRRKK